MKKDLDLEKKVLELIKLSGRYLNAEEILSLLGIPHQRVYLSYRGINITELNKKLGFVRRTPTNHSNLFAKGEYSSPEKILEAVKKTILREGRYLSSSDFRKLGLKPGAHLIYKSGIDLHKINLDLGFIKASPGEKINKPLLVSSIEDYILEKGRYVSQQEISNEFNVSVGYLTQSDVDTVFLNAKSGYFSGYNFFEVLLVSVLIELGITSFEREKTFHECRSQKNRLLRFDMYLPEHNLLIELDGPQHWDSEHPFFSESMQYNDRKKDSFCMENNFNLLRIPFLGRYKTSKSYVKQKLLETLESLPSYNIVRNDKCER